MNTTNNDSHTAQGAYDNDTYYGSSDIVGGGGGQDGSKKRTTSIKDKIMQH